MNVLDVNRLQWPRWWGAAAWLWAGWWSRDVGQDPGHVSRRFASDQGKLCACL